MEIKLNSVCRDVKLEFNKNVNIQISGDPHILHVIVSLLSIRIWTLVHNKFTVLYTVYRWPFYTVTVFVFKTISMYYYFANE